MTDNSSDQLGIIIDPRDYRTFAGPDWPSYQRLVAGDCGNTAPIQAEVRDFIKMMQETYQARLLPGDVLAQANQQRQKQVFFDKQYHGSHCDVPWNTLGVNNNGDVFICQSPSWIPKFVGNILDCDDIYDILNSDLALSIRQEILQGNYTYCNHKLCGFFGQISPDLYATQGPEKQPDKINPSLDTYLDQIPKNIILDFDYTCNFICPSCRTELINNNNDHVVAPINDRIAQKIKDLIIDRITTESVTIRWCGGEPFISRVYTDLMQYICSNKPNNVRHILQTNGSYLKKKSDLVLALLPAMENIRVSFDAACAQTYQRVRVNGQWDQLLENVRWLREQINLVAPNCRLEADFVVQLDNYEEIPAFVKLCNELKIDHINWQKMWNWDTWSPVEFSRRNVYTVDHELYPDLVKTFAAADQPMQQPSDRLIKRS
jgi:sulfatase maturation enzyme AslB (radical SAM superfamily)